eukprot:CAMPEP_0168330236 /NCGR_PEP_ID=MMETSP0213-20121227/7597_1 /TAXON_ID=151035 /ORGANISM="Euplotes harpa, Strain FSP1.4" /LENGTH=117 /DNA_ID=CAMNT_0008333741 /DNA_START=53 /DNA_END=403 /DNA_ORIENTATION=-
MSPSSRGFLSKPEEEHADALKISSAEKSLEKKDEDASIEQCPKLSFRVDFTSLEKMLYLKDLRTIMEKPSVDEISVCGDSSNFLPADVMEQVEAKAITFLGNKSMSDVRQNNVKEEE